MRALHAFFPLVFSVAALGASASGGATKAASLSAWAPYLEELNRPVSPENKLILPYSHAVDVDLLKLHDDEMRAIKRSWDEGPSKEQRASKTATREAQNQFFHQKVTAFNAQTFVALEKAAHSHAAAKKDYHVLVERVLAEVGRNPVARLDQLANYDEGGQIGFCFGRALLIHHLLLKAGVDQGDLAKIFNFGQLMVGKQLWTFHVAVLIRDSVAGFLVVDPLQAKPLPYKEWIAINTQYDIKGRLSRARFYVTDPRKFLPAFGAYDARQLADPVLKTYFDDLARSLDK